MAMTGLLSKQGEKSINVYFIMVPLSKKVLKYCTPKPRYHGNESKPVCGRLFAPLLPPGRRSPFSYLWLVGNGRMVIIVVIIAPHSSIPY